MKKGKTLNEEKAERLIELMALCAYPFKMKFTREDGEPYLLAVAKGKTVDTGSVEVSMSGIHKTIVWYRDGERSQFFELYDDGMTELLMDAFCALLGMQPKLRMEER